MLQPHVGLELELCAEHRFTFGALVFPAVVALDVVAQTRPLREGQAAVLAAEVSRPRVQPQVHAQAAARSKCFAADVTEKLVEDFVDIAKDQILS